MPSFWSYIGNEEYNVGCTGQTVYVYNKAGKELAKFKDIKYAYHPVISPDGDTLVVKSTEGWLAVYSLSELCLKKKFRFSKVDGAQDDNCCFSPDGKEFFNIERHVDSLKTALSVYDTADFSLKRRILQDNFDMVINHIECDAETQAYFLLGYFRDPVYGVADKFFVAKLRDDRLEDIAYIPSEQHWYYLGFLDLKDKGFTKKAKQWSECNDLDGIELKNHSLKELWDNTI